MSEDCLTLNVVAPAELPDEPLPVMFFIHGGGYMLGSSATTVYDGAAIARRGAIYVSANYRLGALGCLDLSSLSTPEHPLEDNLFLRDLVLALRWVRDNIAGFGGDPGNVTIFGESAGAHAVATLLAVPDAAGLFHRAISESPPGGLIHSADYSAGVARKLVAELGADPADGARAVMTARPSQLVRTLEQIMTATIRETPDSFGIGATFGGDYLPLTHVEAMTRGEAHRVPLIIGSNATEASLFARFMDYLPTNEPVIEKFLARRRTRCGATDAGRLPGISRQGRMSGVRQRLHLRSEGMGARRGAQPARADLPLPLRLRPAAASVDGLRRHARHRAVRRVRRVSVPPRGVAHRGG